LHGYGFVSVSIFSSLKLLKNYRLKNSTRINQEFIICPRFLLVTTAYFFSIEKKKLFEEWDSRNGESKN